MGAPGTASVAAAPPPPPTGAPGPPLPPPAALPTRDEITKAWGDSIYRSLPGRARARFSGGRFLEVNDGVAVFVVPNDVHAARCREVKGDVEAALAAHFGVAVPLKLAADPVGPPGGPPEGTALAGRAGTTGAGGPSEPGVADPDEDQDDPFAEAGAFGADDSLPAPVTSPADRLKQAFPGAEEVAP